MESIIGYGGKSRAAGRIDDMWADDVCPSDARQPERDRRFRVAVATFPASCVGVGRIVGAESPRPLCARDVLKAR